MTTLRQIRESNYISRKELADLAGVSESTIVRIEDPNHRTTQEVAEKVLGALSKRIGETITLDSVEGLNLYNVMRDRRLRTKSDQLDEAA
jgi:predicted transcriptional regulator